ncbi:MAG: hypothetical protein V7641_2403 [Blastocatellia bacterium]
MIRQRCTILRALIRWCGADMKRHRRASVIMLTASATVIGLLLMLAPPRAMSRQVGVKAPPPPAKSNSPNPVKPRQMTKPPARKPPAPKAQTLSDEQRAKILTGLRNSFVKISAGEFMMGSDDEKPVHRVRISQSFEMGKYEVTQAQWEALMDSNPSEFKGANLPVENVSWYDAQKFVDKLNARNDGYIYRLPTEAEWEYACRAGTTTEFAFGNSLNSEQANFNGNFPYGNAPNGKNLGHLAVVGSYKPNAWGLYDMHGNVEEWCEDRYDENYYAQSPNSDPPGPEKESYYKVVRGGSYLDGAANLRSAGRGSSTGIPISSEKRKIGFRLVRTGR